MDRSNIFKTELNYIKNEDYKASAKKLLDLVPDYFFEIPAASTGKYHPSFAQGEGGLIRHTKAALRIANELLSLEYMNKEYTEREKDLLLIAILFHDTIKLGNPREKYTRFDHPLLAASFIKDNQSITTFKNEDIKFLERTISSHMGQWNKNSYSDIILPKPSDKYEFFVHECDYLASRNFMDIKFNEKSEIL